jgi:hypothetical protein
LALAALAAFPGLIVGQTALILHLQQLLLLAAALVADSQSMVLLVAQEAVLAAMELAVLGLLTKDMLVVMVTLAPLTMEQVAEEALVRLAEMEQLLLVATVVQVFLQTLLVLP